MKKRHYVLRKSNNAWVQDAYGKYSIKIVCKAFWKL